MQQLKSIQSKKVNLLIAEEFLSQIHESVISTNTQCIGLLQHTGNIRISVNQLRKEIFVCRFDIWLKGANADFLKRVNNTLTPA
jgi:hypothetical protein